jgi:hypothetical protein
MFFLRGESLSRREEPHQFRSFSEILHLLDEPDGSLYNLFSDRLHRMGGAIAEFRM